MKTIIASIMAIIMITGCAVNNDVAKTDQFQLTIQPELLIPVDPMITIHEFNQQTMKQLTDK